MKVRRLARGPKRGAVNGYVKPFDLWVPSYLAKLPRLVFYSDSCSELPELEYASIFGF